MSDTPPDVAARQIERLRAMTPAERLHSVVALNRAVEAMALAGIRAAHPSAAPREVFLRLAVRKLGLELARRAYPEVEGLTA